MQSRDFIAEQGLAFLAHRLRRVSETLVGVIGDCLQEQGYLTPPRGVSTVQLLHSEGPLPVTEIAGALRLSHPLILKLADQLTALGLVLSEGDPSDRRRRIIRLTELGRAEAERLIQTNLSVAKTYSDALERWGIDGLALVELLEADCRTGDFAARLRANLE